MDVKAAQSLIDATLYPLITDEYEREPLVHPQICEMLPWDDRFMYGERIDSLTDVGEPDEVPFGVELPDRSFADGYKVYCRSRKIGQKMTFPIEMMRASDAVNRLQGAIESQFIGQGRRFAQHKEKFIAGMFQYGTLTAGSAKYFDGSFPGEADPYPKFIYDSLPFFDTAHVLKHSATTPSNHTAVAALSSANLEAALTLMERTSAVDERGEPITNMMDVLMVPSGSLEFTASVILGSMQAPGTANNDINPIHNRLRLIPWRYLTLDSDAWWLLRTNTGKRSVRVRDSGSPVVRMYEDEKNQMLVIEAVTYQAACVQDWRGAFNANKAAA